MGEMRSMLRKGSIECSELLGVAAAGVIEDAAEDRARDLHRQVVVVAVDRVLEVQAGLGVPLLGPVAVSRNAALVEIVRNCHFVNGKRILGKMSKRERL